MGRRTGSESVVALIACFLERGGTWSQAALAARVGVSVPSVRRKLVELQEAGVPLERDDRDPPQVYWSVPRKGWLPGTIRFEAGEIADLLRLLSRLPKGVMRTRIIERVVDGYVGQKSAPAERVVVPHSFAPAEEQWLSLVEDAAARGEVLQMRYLSANRGEIENRRVSPHRVVVDNHTRFVATCHKSDSLKWFRVDRITYARLDGVADARKANEEVLDDLIATSVNGFRGAEHATEVRFAVRDPEARWVEGNLPTPLVARRSAEGISVSGRTAAVVQVARFVVSLGAAAVCESQELRAVVRDLAEGALAANEPERLVSRANRKTDALTFERR
jgi:predicted DNA-binding transcriptional regulator YafY